MKRAARYIEFSSKAFLRGGWTGPNSPIITETSV